MKRQIFNAISAVLGVSILLTISVSANAQIPRQDLKPKILSTVQREKTALNTPVEVNIAKYSEDISTLLNSKSKQILKSFNVNSDEVKDVEVIRNNCLNKIVNRADIGNTQVDLDTKGNIVHFRNNNDFSKADKDKRDYTDNEPLTQVTYKINTSNDLTAIINNISSTNDLQDYKLVDCNNEIEGVWNLTWNKDLGDGILNPYDVVTATIDAEDGSIMEFDRNTVTPNAVTPTVTKEQAIQFAKPITSKFNSTNIGASLTVTRPNFYWEEGGPYQPAAFVRLAWQVILDKNIIVMVDAETGEILGGSQTQATDYGRALGPVPSFYMNSACVNMAYNGLNVLGYNQPGISYQPVFWSITQTDINSLFSNPNIYGLYLSCHGAPGIIADSTSLSTAHWVKYASQISGHWHFVYFDACETALDLQFTNAMHLTSAGTCFVGWNNSVPDVTSYQFDTRFWSEIGKMSIRDAVITARDQTLAAGYSECNPGFHGDGSYYGWAW